MKLRINSKDHKLVEDDFGSPVFRFLSIHTSDIELIIKRFNSDLDEVEDLKERLEVAEGKLDQIGNTL